MNYKNVIKKQSFIIVGSVVLMALIIIGSSYALFNNINKSTTEQVVEAGTLTVTYTGSSDAPINSTTIVPDDDSSPYTIKVKNTGTLGMDYDLLIYTGENNAVPHGLIVVKIDDQNPITLKDITTRTAATQDVVADDSHVSIQNTIRYVLTTGTLGAAGAENDEKTHTLKVWIDEDADESLENSDIEVYAQTQGRVQGTAN